MLRISPVSSRARTWPALVILSAIGLLSGCDDHVLAPVPAAPTAERAVVEGVVSASVSGDPIAGAIVSIGAVSATAGPDGHFALTDLAAGPATLRGIASGFEDFEAGITVTSGSMTRNILMTRVELGSLYAVYDLTAPITSFDPAWGVDMEGALYSAVVALSQGTSGASDFGGTFTDWRYVDPGGESILVQFEWPAASPGTGSVTGSFHPTGDVVIEVGQSWYMRGDVLASGDIVGTFGCCGHITGTFTAIRRPTE